jgi:hypothetical protein
VVFIDLDPELPGLPLGILAGGLGDDGWETCILRAILLTARSTEEHAPREVRCEMTDRNHMRRREFIFGLAGAPAAWPLAARAQQAGKVYRLGFLTAGAPIPGVTALGDALQELGWVEGKNIVWERRYAENRLDRLPELAAELVRLKVDVIVAAGTLAPLAGNRATAKIPIVMTAAGDPVGSGLVSNLARPGGNVTGLSLMVPDLGGKRLVLETDDPGEDEADADEADRIGGLVKQRDAKQGCADRSNASPDRVGSPERQCP